MILAALSFIVGFKAGLFNIGISGQMLAAGFLATSIVGYSDLNAVLAKPLVILIGILAGGALGAFVGFLKYKFNIHEVVSTIMINYIINYLTGFFINTYFADMLTRSMKICGSNARLTWTSVQLAGVKCDIPLGIVLAVAAAFVVKFIFDKRCSALSSGRGHESKVCPVFWHQGRKPDHCLHGDLRHAGRPLPV